MSGAAGVQQENRPVGDQFAGGPGELGLGARILGALDSGGSLDEVAGRDRAAVALVGQALLLLYLAAYAGCAIWLKRLAAEPAPARFVARRTETVR